MPSPYAPDEPPSVLWYEQAVNASAHLGSIAYGIHIAVCYTVLSTILRDKERRGWVWLPFVGTLFALGTINIACCVNFNETAWIDERNYPGGPLAFLQKEQNRGTNVTALATSIVTLVLADLLLISRCHALWKKFYVTASLGVVLVASVVMSVLHSIQVARPVQNTSNLTFSIPYASLAMSLNILLTLILLSRILDLRRRLPPATNAAVRAKLTSIEGLVIESALPSGVFSFIFIVLYGLGNAAGILISTPLVQVMGIVSELIILRILNKHAWNLDVVRAVGTTTTMLRDRAGRAAVNPGTHEVSMVTLNDNGSKDSVYKSHALV